MNLAARIDSFEMLGDRLRRFDENSSCADLLPLVEASRQANLRNPWFTPGNIKSALNSLGLMLSPGSLDHWLSRYGNMTDPPGRRKIGVVMAGNIPAVGFHDFLCVLLAGHKIVAKLSASDDQLLPAMAGILTDFRPEWNDCISFTSGKLENFDAIIATGSTNTSRYFDFYFGKYPHIIRRNRNGVAVLSGVEQDQDLQNLADDLMLYYGLGCRNVSKIYVPAGYDFAPLIEALRKFSDYANHHKYRNNYDYFRSVFLVSQVPFMDTGFLILKEDPSIASRIAVLHYEYYDNVEEVAALIGEQSESIQCVVSNMELSVSTLAPGETQKPALWDYADGVDTMEFLLSLH